MNICVLCTDEVSANCPAKRHCEKHHEIYGVWTG